MTGARHGGAGRPREEGRWAGRLLVGGALALLAALLLLPAASVLSTALAGGGGAWWRAVSDPEAWAAVRLTLLVAAIAVPLNTVAGVAAAWSLGRFRHPGQGLLLALVELPLSVPPVVAGMAAVLLFGEGSRLGGWCAAHGLRIVGAVPGVVLTTVLVTFPFVARELLPALEQQGADEEEAAFALGASGVQILRRVTLPNLRWNLVAGVILCNARAMGEFGAASIVSGHLRGITETVPLHVEGLYRRHALQAAFSVASLLFLLAVPTLVAQRWAERAGRPASGAP